MDNVNSPNAADMFGFEKPEKKVQFEVEKPSHQVKIKVIGVGGCGCNIVDSMYDLGIKNVEFYVINTDSQALSIRKCPNKIQIGGDVTSGLGAGATPEVGEKAALSAKNVLKEIIQDADMIFITAGLGGGTGTGASPVIASIARELGILTVAFVTRPFKFEGPQRIKRAALGLEKIREVSDTMIVISNEKLLEVVGKKAKLTDAFAVANNVLAQGVQSISDLITVPGLINVDFADVKTIIGNTGKAVMGIGIGKGENRACEAIKKACASSLLDKIVIKGATGVLVCFSGSDILLEEIYQAMNLIYTEVNENANIILGVVIDPSLKDEIKVTIIATGAKNAAEDALTSSAPFIHTKQPQSQPVIIAAEEPVHRIQPVVKEVKESVPEELPKKEPEPDIKTKLEKLFFEDDVDYPKTHNHNPAIISNPETRNEIRPEIDRTVNIQKFEPTVSLQDSPAYQYSRPEVINYANPAVQPGYSASSSGQMNAVLDPQQPEIKEEEQILELSKHFEKAINDIKVELDSAPVDSIPTVENNTQPENAPSVSASEPTDVIDEVPSYLRRKRRFFY